MKTIPLPFETVAETGFTHKVIVGYADISAAATTKTLQLFPETSTATFTAGYCVLRAAFSLNTTFDGGATSSLTIQVGDGTDPNRYIDATQIHEDATEVDYWVGKVTTSPHAYTAADAVDALFTAVGANTEALTSGEIEIYLKLVDLARLKKVR